MEVLEWIGTGTGTGTTYVSLSPTCKCGCELKIFSDNSLITNTMISGSNKKLGDITSTSRSSLSPQRCGCAGGLM